MFLRFGDLFVYLSYWTFSKTQLQNYIFFWKKKQILNEPILTSSTIPSYSPTLLFLNTQYTILSWRM